MADDLQGKREKKKHKKSKKEKADGKERTTATADQDRDPSRFAPEAGYEVTSATSRLSWTANGSQELWLLRLPLEWPQEAQGTLQLEETQRGTVGGTCTDSAGDEFHAIMEHGNIPSQVFAADMGPGQPVAISKQLTLVRKSQLLLPKILHPGRGKELSPPQGLQQHDKKAKKKKRKQEEGSAVGSDSGERSSKGDKQRKKVKREKHPDKNVSST